MLYLLQYKHDIILDVNDWRQIMDVCYNKLFKLLIDKGLRKMEFAEKAGISQNTMAKLAKNQYVSMEVLIKICKGLDCNIDCIMDVILEKK